MTQWRIHRKWTKNKCKDKVKPNRIEKNKRLKEMKRKKRNEEKWRWHQKLVWNFFRLIFVVSAVFVAFDIFVGVIWTVIIKFDPVSLLLLSFRLNHFVCLFRSKEWCLHTKLCDTFFHSSTSLVCLQFRIYFFRIVFLVVSNKLLIFLHLVSWCVRRLLFFFSNAVYLGNPTITKDTVNIFNSFFPRCFTLEKPKEKRI